MRGFSSYLGRVLFLIFTWPIGLVVCWQQEGSLKKGWRCMRTELIPYMLKRRA